jgi:ABC-2 type transport system ATP-binding protein
VLILDEPTIGLDPAQVREVRDLIRHVGQDRTVMLSTHILSEVEQLCSRVLIINRGHIIAEDAPSMLSSRLQSSNRFLVRVGNAEPDAVVEALHGLRGVKSVEQTERGIEVFSARNADARPAVAAAVVGRQWDLLELHALDLSLEDIFLQLTTDDTRHAEEAQ